MRHLQLLLLSRLFLFCHCDVSWDKAIRRAYILKTLLYIQEDEDSSGFKYDLTPKHLLWC